MASEQPSLSPEGRREANLIVNEFEHHLKSLAGCLAKEAGASKVAEPHVRDAYAVLRKCGRKPPPKWFWRSDFRVGIGSLMVGIAFAISSVAKDVITIDGKSLAASVPQNPGTFWLAMVITPAALLISGALIAMNGWMRGDD